MSQYPGFRGEGRGTPVVIPSPLSWWLWLLGDAHSGPQGQCRWPNALSPRAMGEQQHFSSPCNVWGMGRSRREDGICWNEWGFFLWFFLERWSWGTTVLVWSSLAQSPALWLGIRSDMLVCESNLYSMCFYKCPYGSQVMVLISTKILRKEKVLIVPSLPHIVLVLFIIRKEFLSLDHFCFPKK